MHSLGRKRVCALRTHGLVEALPLIMTRSRPEARPAWGDSTPGSPALSATFSTSQRGWRTAPLKDVWGAAGAARVSGGGLMDLSQPCSFAVELLFSLPLSQLRVFPAPCQCWIIYTDRKRKLSLSQSQGSPLTHLSHGQMSPVHYLWGEMTAAQRLASFIYC